MGWSKFQPVTLGVIVTEMMTHRCLEAVLESPRSRPKHCPIDF